MKRKTLTGLAEHISLSGEVRCGGAVVKQLRTSLDASLESTKRKMTTRKVTRARKNEKKNSIR